MMAISTFSSVVYPQFFRSAEVLTLGQDAPGLAAGRVIRPENPGGDFDLFRGGSARILSAIARAVRPSAARFQFLGRSLWGVVFPVEQP